MTGAFQRLQPLNGAVITSDQQGAIELRTSPTPWAYSLVAELCRNAPDSSADGVRASLDLEVQSGTAGLFLVDGAGRGPLGKEIIVDGSRREVTVVLDAPADACQLCIRTGASGPAVIRIRKVRTWIRRTYDITDSIDGLMPVLLKEPGPVALAAVAAALSSSLKRVVEPEEIGRLECRNPAVPVSFEALWDDPLSRLVWDETLRLVDLMPTYEPEKMDPRTGYHGYLGREFFAAYLKQSAIRVYHLLRRLREMNVTGGEVVEVGGLFGQFALPLRQLGYDVTVVDRYRTFDGALAGYVEHMRGTGIHVVETDRSDEHEWMERLGQFDVAIAMAVIEHIPHTPREFMKMLVSHVRPGGAVAIDTPNISRYWNRRHLAEGRSIHQDIVSQFHAHIPYEGHHREFTAAEVAWMFEQIGCTDVTTTLFDYNLLQFKELTGEHITALLSMTVDPTLADTILAVGRLPGQTS